MAKSNHDIALEVIAGKWGNGITRQEKLTKAGYNYDAIQKEVNKILTSKDDSKPVKLKSIDIIAQEVINGKWGNGNDRKNKLIKAGYDYDKVQAKVNELLTKKTPVVISTAKKVKGIDISAWQGKISKANFEKIKKSGINFVILRLGYTGSKSKEPTLDNTFENNYKNAIAAGLPVGIYYYSLATTTTKAKEEAEFCIKHLKNKKISYPVYIDMEDPYNQARKSKSTLAAVCDAFCNTIKAAGYKPGVYASLSWFNNKIGAITATHSKWVAQYYTQCQYKDAYDMWQYSSSGSVPGIPGRVDMNYWYNK